MFPSCRSCGNNLYKNILKLSISPSRWSTTHFIFVACAAYSRNRPYHAWALPWGLCCRFGCEVVRVRNVHWWCQLVGFLVWLYIYIYIFFIHLFVYLFIHSVSYLFIDLLFTFLLGMLKIELKLTRNFWKLGLGPSNRVTSSCKGWRSPKRNCAEVSYWLTVLTTIGPFSQKTWHKLWLL